MKTGFENNLNVINKICFFNTSTVSARRLIRAECAAQLKAARFVFDQSGASLLCADQSELAIPQLRQIRRRLCIFIQPMAAPAVASKPRAKSERNLCRLFQTHKRSPWRILFMTKCDRREQPTVIQSSGYLHMCPCLKHSYCHALCLQRIEEIFAAETVARWHRLHVRFQMRWKSSKTALSGTFWIFCNTTPIRCLRCLLSPLSRDRSTREGSLRSKISI